MFRCFNIRRFTILFAICQTVILAATHQPCTGAPEEKVAAVCFVHYGPQDKPMPSFCIINPEARSAFQLEVSSLPGFFPTAIAWERVEKIVASPQSPSRPPRPAVFGVYRAMLVPSNETRYLAPEQILAIGAIIASDMESQHKEIPEEIQYLFRRMNADESFSRE